MANLKVDWVLPTTRKSGKPLDPAQIDSVKIELSADGTNFGEFGSFAPAILSAQINELEPGTWSVRGTVKDTAGLVSAPVVQSIVIPDTTAPSELVSLSLTLV